MAQYPELNGTLVRQDIMEIFVYANVVTNNWFGLFVVFSFFMVTFLGTMFLQKRFVNDVMPEKCLLASSFSTFGFIVILNMKSGIIDPIYLFIVGGIAILSIIWNLMGNN